MKPISIKIDTNQITKARVNDKRKNFILLLFKNLLFLALQEPKFLWDDVEILDDPRILTTWEVEFNDQEIIREEGSVQELGVLFDKVYKSTQYLYDEAKFAIGQPQKSKSSR